MEDLVKIDNSDDLISPQKNKEKEYSSWKEEETLDWRDYTYRLPDYHKEEDWFILGRDTLNKKEGN